MSCQMVLQGGESGWKLWGGSSKSVEAEEPGPGVPRRREGPASELLWLHKTLQEQQRPLLILQVET